jgi:RNAse (barnase) inhibitor barstar
MFSRTTNYLMIDLAGPSTREELHALLAAALEFPEYYGHDWDAFDECLRDATLPPHVTIRGLGVLREKLPHEADLFAQCVRGFVSDLERKNFKLLDK